ncbi:hypothetical protein Dimus_005190 [Dionaea muscipula]
MDNPRPTANHVPAVNGAANQRPLREYGAPQVNGALPALAQREGEFRALANARLGNEEEGEITAQRHLEEEEEGGCRYHDGMTRRTLWMKIEGLKIVGSF